MEVFTIDHLSFAYPEQEKNAISDLSLSVQPGEFLVLCGPSGCGKSTLLRQLKTVLAPHGRRSGEILFDGKNLDELPQREQAEKIGRVADGVIVGSAIVKIIAQYGDDAAPHIYDYVKAMKEATIRG